MGTVAITIRPFEEADVTAAAALETSGGGQVWTPGILRDELAADNRSYVVAESDVVIGYGGIMVIGEEAHVTNLLVAPERRRQGVGRRILTALVRNAVAMGARHLTLEVRSDNEVARRLYHRFGMTPVGVRPGYYQGEDALILWANDIDSPEYARSLN